MDGVEIVIKPGIYWVGVNDRIKDLFEAIWPIPRGISYNSYLVVDEKVAVVDAVEKGFSEEWYKKIERVVVPSKIDYVIINHMEPDHSGSLPFIRRMVPNATFVVSKKGAEMVNNFYGIRENIRTVGEGDEISLGSKTLRFHDIPYVHWPETMATYLVEDKVLLSGDCFGTYGALDGGFFDDEIDVDYYFEEMLRYYANVIGMYSMPVQKAVAKLGELAIDVLGPSHGPIWRRDLARVMGFYDRWSHWEGEQGVVIAFGSMYGETRAAMEAVARGVAEAGCLVRAYDVSRTSLSVLLGECWRWRGVILGAPTYDTGIFLPMENLLRDLTHKRLKNRVCGLFGSFSWSGGSVKQMRDMVAALQWDIVEPEVAFKSHAGTEQIEQLESLGRAVAERVLNPQATPESEDTARHTA